MNQQDQNFKYVFKVILVGPVSVGKTSIMSQFINGRHSDQYQPTLGIEHFSKTITCNGDRIQIMVWDTAGSEAFRSLTRSYYRSTAGIILVFDITDQSSFEAIDFWLSECKANSSTNATIFLIGNKVDKQDERTITYSEASLYAKRNGLTYYEMSAKSALNVQETFMDLVREIHLKIQKKEIDPYDKEAGARYSENYLLALKDPNMKEQIEKFENKKNVKKNCC